MLNESLEPNLQDLLRRWADSQNIAVSAPERDWTYEDFVSRTAKVANYLRARQISKVMLHMRQGFEAYTLIWGCYIAGVTFCAVGHETPTERLEYCRSLFEPELTVSSTPIHSAMLEEEFAHDLSASAPRFGQASPDLSCEQPAYVLFTSGSTGKPKGVVIPRRALHNVILWSIEEYQVSQQDIWGQYSSLGFDLSLLDIFTAFASGAAVIPLGRVGEKLVPADVIRRKRITIWHSVPSAFELIDRGRQLKSENLQSLRLIIFCGERLFPTLVNKIWAENSELAIYNTYGPTETTILVSYVKLTPENLEKFSRATVSIGHPLPENTLKIDFQDDSELGELIVSGKNVGLGYLGDGGPSGYVVREDGREPPQAYRTGDFCRLVDSIMFFECRRDSQVKILGNRVDLAEVDHALRKIGCSNSATIFHDERIVSFVLAPASVADGLEDRLRSQLPAYYLPSQIKILGDFPYTSSGKVDLKSLIDTLVR